jgi:hypothetical protein
MESWPANHSGLRTTRRAARRATRNPTGDWIHSEPPLADRREWRRLVRRAAARGRITIGVTVVLTLAMVGWRARKAPSFSSRVVLRVTEGPVEANAAPPTNRALRAYLNDVALSGERLQPILSAHHLYHDKVQRDPAGAVEDLREDLALEVWRNYFIEGRRPGEQQSARIGVTYASKDPELALMVAREVAGLIVRAEQSSRIEQAETAQREGAISLASARAELQARQELAARLRMRLERTSEAHGSVELARMDDELQHLDEQLTARIKRQTELDLQVDLERSELGLEFVVVDPGRVAPPPPSRPRALALFGLVWFCLLLVPVGVAVGAFARRVTEADDVRGLGLEVLGEVAAYDGDQQWTLEARVHAARYTRRV